MLCRCKSSGISGIQGWLAKHGGTKKKEAGSNAKMQCEGK